MDGGFMMTLQITGELNLCGGREVKDCNRVKTSAFGSSYAPGIMHN